MSSKGIDSLVFYGGTTTADTAASASYTQIGGIVESSVTAGANMITNTKKANGAIETQVAGNKTFGFEFSFEVDKTNAQQTAIRAAWLAGDIINIKNLDDATEGGWACSVSISAYPKAQDTGSMVIQSVSCVASFLPHAV